MGSNGELLVTSAIETIESGNPSSRQAATDAFAAVERRFERMRPVDRDHKQVLDLTDFAVEAFQVAQESVPGGFDRVKDFVGTVIPCSSKPTRLADQLARYGRTDLRDTPSILVLRNLGIDHVVMRLGAHDEGVQFPLDHTCSFKSLPLDQVGEIVIETEMGRLEDGKPPVLLAFLVTPKPAAVIA